MSIEWMPFELRPAPAPTLEPDGDYLQRAWATSVYPLARQMGVRIVLPRVSPQPHTHLAFEGYQFAKANGKGTAYNHRVLQAFFQQEQDIGDVDVLTKLAAEVGLDPQAFREALQKRTYQETHQQALHDAYFKAGVTGVPHFIIGTQTLTGLQSAETLTAVIDEELRKQRTPAPEQQAAESRRE